MAQQETSALFSLNELMRLEDERVKNEIEARLRHAEAAERQRVEAVRIAREREIAALRKRDEKRLDEEARAREELVRFEAIRVAERERAGIEQMTREALAAQLEHQRKLAGIAGRRATNPRRRTLTRVVAAFSALGLVLVALYFGKTRHAGDRTGEIEAMIASGHADNERMQRTIDEQNRKVDELEARLRAEREAVTTAPQIETPPKIEKPPAAHHAPKPSPAAPPCTCDQHDPLCGCWKR